MLETLILSYSIYVADSVLSGMYSLDFLKPRFSKRLTFVMWTALYLCFDVLIYEMLARDRGVLGIFTNILFMIVLQILLFKRDYIRQMFVTLSFVAGKDILKYIISVLYYSVSNVTWGAIVKVIESSDSMNLAKSSVIVKVYIIFLSIMCIIIYVALFYAYLKLIRKKYVYRSYDPSFGETVFLIFPCVTALCISITLRILVIKVNEGVYTLAYDSSQEVMLWIVIISVLLLVSIVLTMMLFQYLVKHNEEIRKQIILENQIGQIHREIEEIESIYSDLRGLKHDMRNHLNSILQFVQGNSGNDMGVLEGYVGQIEEAVNKLDFSAKSGNPITDIIIYQRQQEARKNQICFDVNFIFPSEGNIDVYDVAVVLNNALDNAFEACRKVDGEKEIRLRSYMKGTMFFIDVENDYSGSISIDAETGLPRTSKEDKRIHGIGIENIQKCAKKYMGDIDIEMRSESGRKRFLLTVMMSSRISLQK